MKLVLSSLLVAGLVAGAASSALSPSAPSPVLPAAAAFQIDNGHSAVVFHSKHLGISHAYGRFNQMAGQVTYDGADLSKSSIQLTVMAESVDTNSPDRDKHLRSADFFSAKEFPEIVFESKKIGGSKDALTIEGSLTFLGKTKPVTAKGMVTGEGDTFMGDHRAGFVAEFDFDMADFGVAFVQKTPGAVGPEVHVTVSLESIRE